MTRTMTRPMTRPLTRTIPHSFAPVDLTEMRSARMIEVGLSMLCAVR